MDPITLLLIVALVILVVGLIYTFSKQPVSLPLLAVLIACTIVVVVMLIRR